MADPPPGPRAKIKRAKKHLDDLHSEIVAFHDEDPYTIVSEPHPEGGWRARIDPWPAPISPCIPLTFGDLIHNLRSSLDILICDLIRDHRPQDVDNASGFPIMATAEKVKSEIGSQVKGARNAVQQAVMREKPYKGGNPPLWQLHQLDILDKHKLILPTISGINESVNIGNMLATDLSGPLAELGLSPPAELTLWLHSADRCADEGGVIFVDRTRSEPNYDLEFKIFIAIHQPGLVECESIMPFATQMIDVVEDIIVRFDQYFV